MGNDIDGGKGEGSSEKSMFSFGK